MTKEQIMRRLNCSEKYAQRMIDWASNELELRVLVAQRTMSYKLERGLRNMDQQKLRQLKTKVKELKVQVVIARHNVRASEEDVDRVQFLDFADSMIKQINEMMEEMK